ncbi:hypothetical protein, partial [Nostoc piscinale]|uniref:hypothetical protein n=1 Tax=Nostoc piscinale TaxID=224012 RepID=UPI0039A47BA6
MCDFFSNLTPNPFPTFAQRVADREGEQNSKPLSVSGRGLERGYKNKLHIALISNFYYVISTFTLTNAVTYFIVSVTVDAISINRIGNFLFQQPIQIIALLLTQWLQN